MFYIVVVQQITVDIKQETPASETTSIISQATQHASVLYYN
jgi:hypothetical protein